MCIAEILHNTADSSVNIPLPPDQHHCSDEAKWRLGGERIRNKMKHVFYSVSAILLSVIRGVSILCCIYISKTIEGTHRVRTHAVLLLSVKCSLT